MDAQTGSLANKLLAALPYDDFNLLKTHLTIVPVAQGALLFEADTKVEQVFFPLSSRASRSASPWSRAGGATQESGPS
jgi:hypothetical protein